MDRRPHAGVIARDGDALLVARVSANGPAFWLHIRRRSALRHALLDPLERERIDHLRPLETA